MKIKLLAILFTLTGCITISCTQENRNSSLGKEDSVHGRTTTNTHMDTTPAPADNTSNVAVDTAKTSPQP